MTRSAFWRHWRARRRWPWACICRNTAALRCPCWRSPAGSCLSADCVCCPPPCWPNRRWKRKRGQSRRLPVSVPVRCGAGLCAVVRRHRQTAARRRVVAGIAQPRLCLRAGLAVPRPGHGREIAGGLRAGAGFDFRGAAGGSKGYLKTRFLRS